MVHMPLRFQFDERKGREALAYIASRWPNVTVFYASKALFFAEKAHLNRYGRPIVADTFVAMPNGPVPSTLYDFLKSEFGLAGDPDAFRGAISTDNYPTIASRREPEEGVLSQSDLECLDEAIAFCRVRGFSHLSQLTHQEKAWAEASNNGPMDYEDFIEENNPNREAILNDAREFAAYGVL
ncbi:MAG: SocA family protein [Sphingomonas sp.]|nr:SocA family protein [Sphingomonas sp.]